MWLEFIESRNALSEAMINKIKYSIFTLLTYKCCDIQIVFDGFIVTEIHALKMVSL